MSEPKVGYTFLLIPLTFVIVVLLLAIWSAGGVDEFIDGLGFNKISRG